MTERPGAGTPEPGDRRRGRAAATRDLLLRTAERLYAERGIAEVSNRHVAEAAGQANNSAVAYHVGTKADLVEAISRRHAEPVTRRTERMVAGARGSSDPRDHIACLVRPYLDHLASLGTPSWCARFVAQTTTDPAAQAQLFQDPALDGLMREAFLAVRAHMPDLPDHVVALRYRMMRVMTVHTCAEQERTAADDGTSAGWALVADTLVDAATGVLLAPAGRQRVEM